MSLSAPVREPVSGTAVSPRTRKPFLLDLYGTAVGKKYAMAISGIALMGFVLFHMIGNLKMYFGAADLNEYAEFLKKLLYPLAPKESVLWILRLGLLGMLALHLHAAWSLTMLNRRARPVRYQSARDYQEASLASRSMRLSGIVVLAFIVWHLLDLTFGVVNTVGADGEFVACRGVRQRGAQLRTLAGCAVLRGGKPAARTASEPWCVEHLPIARLEQPSIQRVAHRICSWIRRGGGVGQRVVSHRSNSRNRQRLNGVTI